MYCIHVLHSQNIALYIYVNLSNLFLQKITHYIIFFKQHILKFKDKTIVITFVWINLYISIHTVIFLSLQLYFFQSCKVAVQLISFPTPRFSYHYNVGLEAPPPPHRKPNIVQLWTANVLAIGIAID